MLLKVFWGSLELVFGAVGGVSGALLASNGGLHPSRIRIMSTLRLWNVDPFFQVIVFLILEPLAVDVELPSGPSHPQKP